MREDADVRGSPPLMTRRSTFALLAVGAFGPVFAEQAPDAARAATPGALEQAHARIAGGDAISLGTRLLGLLDPAATRALVDAQGERFAAAMGGEPPGRSREVFALLAAEDFRGGRVRVVRDLWLADIEIALLVAPLVHESAACAG